MESKHFINLIPYPVAIISQDKLVTFNTSFDVCFRKKDSHEINSHSDLLIESEIKHLIENINHLSLIKEVYCSNKVFDLEIKLHYNTGEMILFATDRTRYYQLKKRFSFLDATLKTLVDIVPQFIFWKDINSIFQGCNRKFAHAAKLKSPDDIIHKTDRDMPWAVNAEKFLRDDQNVLYSGEPMLRYDEKQNIEGNERIMRVDKVPLIVNKEVQGLLGVYEDVTEVRTLKNDIQIAVRDKNQSSQFVDDFILNMQHDIRTPLTGIIGLGEIISNMEKEDIVEIKNASKDIISSGNRLLRYCESMVDYHKMNKSNEALVDKPIVVSELINNIIDMQRPALNVKNLGINSHVFPENSTIISDYSRLERILVNIVSNAVKFTLEGSISVTAEVSALPESRNALLSISVIDTGPGIREENINILFEHFSKEVPSFRSVHHGMGLGLRMVKILVEDLKGDINVTSEMGKGSTFTIDIPVILPLRSIFSSQSAEDMRQD